MLLAKGDTSGPVLVALRGRGVVRVGRDEVDGPFGRDELRRCKVLIGNFVLIIMLSWNEPQKKVG